MFASHRTSIISFFFPTHINGCRFPQQGSPFKVLGKLYFRSIFLEAAHLIRNEIVVLSAAF